MMRWWRRWKCICIRRHQYTNDEYVNDYAYSSTWERVDGH